MITGGNSGIGKETAAELAGMGAHVIIAARNPAKAAAAVKEIQQRAPDATVEHLPLDLASFASVRAFADTFNARFDRLDVLVNNAGATLREAHRDRRRPRDAVPGEPPEPLPAHARSCTTSSRPRPRRA